MQDAFVVALVASSPCACSAASSSDYRRTAETSEATTARIEILANIFISFFLLIVEAAAEGPF